MAEILGPTPEEMGVKESGETKLTPEQQAQFQKLLLHHLAASPLEKDKIQPVMQDPRRDSYELKRTHIDRLRAGEYTVNPETAQIDWKTVDPSQLELVKVPPDHGYTALEYLRENLNEDYLFPGIEFAAAVKNKEITLPEITDVETSHVTLPGTLVRGQDGKWGAIGFNTDRPETLTLTPIILPLSRLSSGQVHQRFLVLRKSAELPPNES